MKLSNIHLLIIVLLSVFVGGWGILGIKEAYENIEKPKHLHEDYMCSVVPKKIPKDIQMKHYAASNSIEAAKKQHFADCKTAECRAKRAQAAATSANSPPKMMLTDEELAFMEKKANTPEKKRGHEMSISMYKALIGNPDTPDAEKMQITKMAREEFAKAGCHPPKGGSPTDTSNGAQYEAQDPNYRCLRLHSLQHNHAVNEERVGATSLERRRRLPCSQIPKGQENDYILKTKIVPPVCPKCPDCPSMEFLYKQLLKKKKEEDDEEVEDDLDKNEIKPGESRAAMRREKRKRTRNAVKNPAQNAPGVMEAANRKGKYNPNAPNETAFSAQSAYPIPRLNSFSAFG